MLRVDEPDRILSEDGSGTGEHSKRYEETLVMFRTG